MVTENGEHVFLSLNVRPRAGPLRRPPDSGRCDCAARGASRTEPAASVCFWPQAAASLTGRKLLWNFLEATVVIDPKCHRGTNCCWMQLGGTPWEDLRGEPGRAALQGSGLGGGRRGSVLQRGAPQVQEVRRWPRHGTHQGAATGLVGPDGSSRAFSGPPCPSLGSRNAGSAEGPPRASLCTSLLPPLLPAAPCARGVSTGLAAWHARVPCECARRAVCAQLQGKADLQAWPPRRPDTGVQAWASAWPAAPGPQPPGVATSIGTQ